MSDSSTKNLTIEMYMTPSPHTIGPYATLTEAHELMRSHKIRHLPVVNGGKLVGMVTLRDLHLLETLPDVHPDQVPVEDAMAEEVYQVAPDAPLDGVADIMADKKYGSAVVVKDNEVVGVFTVVDALHALRDALRRVDKP